MMWSQVIVRGKLTGVLHRYKWVTHGTTLSTMMANPIPLLASPLKGEELGSLPFKGGVGVGMGQFSVLV